MKTLLLSCPGCYATFRENYPEVARHLGLEFDLKVRHTTEYFQELLASGRLKLKKPLNLKATYHDSCHLGRWNGIYEEPRRALRAVPGVELVEMEHHHENALCCGLVCAFNSMGIVADAGVRRVQEAIATGADTMVTACAGCGSQFTATAAAMKAPLEVHDYTDLLAEAAGLPVLDTRENIGRFMQAAVEVLKDSRIVKR